jgi:uncharacterized protein
LGESPCSFATWGADKLSSIAFIDIYIYSKLNSFGDFMFERSDERRDLFFHVQQGRSILMLAPRRVGKTWLMGKFAEDLRTQGWMTVQCDVEGMSKPTEFLRHLCQQIEKQEEMTAKIEGRAKQMLSQLFSKDIGDGWQVALGNMDWPSFAETLVRGLDSRGKDTVILIDELALFVLAMLEDDPAAAKNFLYALRSLKQRYSKVRWLFTGSIGLDIIAKRAGIGGALVDLELFPIEPFSPEAARAFLDHLSATKRVLRPFALDEAAFKRLIEELGWLSPYYLEHIAQKIRPSGPLHSSNLPFATVQDVDTAFTTMLDVQHRTYFVAWEEHLSKNFSSQEAERLRRVLDICAAQSHGERFDTLTARLGGPPDNLSRRVLHDLLTVLVADGYLSEVSDDEVSRYRFRSGLLRRYWQRYHAE